MLRQKKPKTFVVYVLPQSISPPSITHIHVRARAHTQSILLVSMYEEHTTKEHKLCKEYSNQSQYGECLSNVVCIFLRFISTDEESHYRRINHATKQMRARRSLVS